LLLTLACNHPLPPPTPAVTGLSLTAGPCSGGTLLDVEGTGFTSDARVSFGSSESLKTTVLSPTGIEVVAPSGSGTVHVRVTTAGGTSPVVQGDQYTYVCATTATTLINDATGGPPSGTEVTGASFHDTATV